MKKKKKNATVHYKNVDVAKTTYKDACTQILDATTIKLNLIFYVELFYR